MRRVNLIPMAGEGQRFIDAGYTTPKPLIDINGLPMVVNTANSLPEADQWIFVCRESHIKSANIDKVLMQCFPGALILTVNQLTAGQVCTCLLARDYLRMDDQLTIGTCDNGMKYDYNKFDDLIYRNDALIWTFRGHSTVLQNPSMYGWVEVDKEGSATGVSCKMPISDNPLQDHAVVGIFSFKKASLFLDCADETIRKDRRINNEFYLDIVMDECVMNGSHISPFEIDDYICWGTPKDLELYNK